MQKLRPLIGAPNAYTFKFEDSLLDEIRDSYESIIAAMLKQQDIAVVLDGGKNYSATVNHPRDQFYLMSFGNSPLLWVSNNSEKTYGMFRRFFDSSEISDDIKLLIDYEQNIQMYCGFYVISDHLVEERWHVDYHPGANAYTLITPLYESLPGHGDLHYFNTAREKALYRYQLNEAVVFGDHFQHSTQTYPKSSSVRVLLSMTFGTDKIQYWDILKQTVGSQSKFMYLPCGHVHGCCHCLDSLVTDYETA